MGSEMCIRDRGEDSSAGGGPRLLTLTQAQELLQLEFAERGKAKVTVSYCREKLRFLRAVHRILSGEPCSELAWPT